MDSCCLGIKQWERSYLSFSWTQQQTDRLPHARKTSSPVPTRRTPTTTTAMRVVKMTRTTTRTSWRRRSLPGSFLVTEVVTPLRRPHNLRAILLACLTGLPTRRLARFARFARFARLPALPTFPLACTRRRRCGTSRRLRQWSRSQPIGKPANPRDQVARQPGN